jgi:hypothetical protein
MDARLPQRFTELSLHSLKHVQNQPFQLIQQDFQQVASLELSPQSIRFKFPPKTLKPIHQETIIAAIDTSVIKIGETITGTLIAIRGANVLKHNKHYRYTRLGPFIFHITEENKYQVYNTLQEAYFDPSSNLNRYSLPSLQQTPTRMANLLERWLQSITVKTLSNSIILFDGSLTAGTPDTPTPLMKQILANARKNGNTVLAFSKMTNLRFNGHIITDLPVGNKPPYLLEMDGLRPKPPITVLGDVYVAKLAHGNCAFRLDIDREVPNERKIESVEKLLGNDLLPLSYPETLRLAHIFCTFTANEVVAMQHFATRQYGLKIVNRPDMHSLLFGPFGKGEYHS